MSVNKLIAEGKLTIHGVTNEVVEEGVITISDGKVTAKSGFMIIPEDYDIKIPGVVRNKIAKEIEINIEMHYDKM